jgi:hypothetical protein
MVLCDQCFWGKFPNLGHAAANLAQNTRLILGVQGGQQITIKNHGGELRRGSSGPTSWKYKKER